MRSKKTLNSQRPAGVRTVQLAHVIANLAARRRWPRGRHVREQELAGELRVSRTPVRAALRLLARHGVVEARPNRGFFLTRDGTRLTSLRLEPPTTVGEQLYANVLRDRVMGRLPEAVTAFGITARYAVSRLAVERVLARLQDEGLLTRSAGRAWRFTPSLEQTQGVRASYEFRVVVEPGAMLLPEFRLVPSEVVEQQQRHREMLVRADAASRRQPPPAAVFDLDAGFHETLARFSGNPFVLHAVQQQNRLRRLLEFESYRDMARVIAWCGEHLSILDRLEAHDIGGASGLLRAHLQRAARVALDWIGA